MCVVRICVCVCVCVYMYTYVGVALSFYLCVFVGDVAMWCSVEVVVLLLAVIVIFPALSRMLNPAPLSPGSMWINPG